MTPDLDRATREAPRRLVVLGSTGSIGTQALEVVGAAARLAGLGVTSVVLDCESPRGVRLRLAADLATVLGARLLPLGEVDLAAETRLGAA